VVPAERVEGGSLPATSPRASHAGQTPGPYDIRLDAASSPPSASLASGWWPPDEPTEPSPASAGGGLPPGPAAALSGALEADLLPPAPPRRNINRHVWNPGGLGLTGPGAHAAARDASRTALISTTSMAANPSNMIGGSCWSASRQPLVSDPARANPRTGPLARRRELICQLG